MTFPGFDRMYDLHDPVGKRPFRGCFQHHDTGLQLSRAEATTRDPVRVTWAMGSAAPGDVIWTTSAHPLIVSARVVELLRSQQLTGWSTYPVRVFDKAGHERDGFAGLAVTGRCGPIDLSKSTVEVRQYPGGHFPEFHGHFFDPATWDGSDFCVPAPDAEGRVSLDRIVSARVVQLFKHNRITNLRLVALSDARISTSVFEVGLQHLLPADFHARVSSAYRAAAVLPPVRYRSEP